MGKNPYRAFTRRGFLPFTSNCSMGAHLRKYGLLKCWKCKKIAALSLFVPRKSNGGTICRQCHTELSALRRRQLGSKQLKLRFQILVRDGFACRYCGRTSATSELHIDHKFPRSAGGLDSLDNLITSCRECNLGKSDAILSSVVRF